MYEQTAQQEFINQMSRRERPDILLTGAKPWPGTVAAEYRQHIRNATWFGTDIEGGQGVDIVGDLQAIDKVTAQRFDGIFCPATLEHIERPWCAVTAMGAALKPGGWLYIQTHQTFPLHGYPSDYFRFSTAALRTLVYDAGLVTVMSHHDGPCSIVPPAGHAVWNVEAEAFLNSCIVARKP